MTRDEIFSGEAGEEDSEIAAALLAELGPDKCAQALARLLRARLPEAEEVVDPGAGQDFSTAGKAPRGARQPMAGGVWFRLDVGRERNADPKWLLPMLCRKGGVTRADIGAIRIFPKDSKVEIAASAADAFLQNMRKPGGDAIRVERVGPPGAATPHEDRAAKGRKPRKADGKS